jgi:hypothetical protein
MSLNVWSSNIAVATFNDLKPPILYFVLEQSKDPQAVEAQVRQISCVERVFKLHVVDLCGHFPAVEIVYVNEKQALPTHMTKSPLLVQKIE